MRVITEEIRGDNDRPSVITIGAYDGVHRGHQAVIAQVRELADSMGCQSVVVTFDRHPASVVRPESAPMLLTDTEQKLELLAETGVDAVCVVKFDEHKARMSAEDFAQKVFVEDLQPKAIVVGEDFHFGYKRQGNVETLRALGAKLGFRVEPVKLIPRPDGVDEPVSSTAIRRALAGGQVEIAARLLGHPFEIRGEVGRGDQRGRTLGFPTANISVPTTMCLPADGVYAGRFIDAESREHRCAVNLGRRPTFVERSDHSLLEAHVLDFSGDLYGQRVRVSFEKFLRRERKFDGLESLRAQLAEDVAAVRATLS
ncbi:MAG: bifunctional riboflavin kinase/FAD synthetase [Actinomycetota bacterium]